MLKCGIYIRVSKDNMEQKTSLENQRDLFIKYAKEKNWEIIDFYVDVESGTSTKRKELARLLNDAENKRIDIIAAKELSRLARHSELAHKIKRIAETNGTHIVTLDGAINTLHGKNNTFGLFAWLYEIEAQNTSERIKLALKSRAERGLFNGSTPPYGYNNINGKLVIRNDETPLIIRRIFSDYISGKGIDSIAMALYNEDVPTPSMIANKSNANNKWHGSSVKKILQNQAYIGNMIQQKESTVSVICKQRKINSQENMTIIENTHEAIISVEDFNLVQELLQTRTHQKYHQATHLFTGIMFCHDCGKGMHFKKNRKGYVCGSFNKHGKKACSDHIIREAELSKLILSDLSSFINSLNNTDFIADFKARVEKHTSEQKNIVSKYEEELNSLNSKISKSIALLMDGTITKAHYDLFISENSTRIKYLENRILESKKILDKFYDDSLLQELNKIKDTIISLDELTPETLHRFIKRIEVKEDGNPRIFYRFPDPNNLKNIGTTDNL